MITVTHYRPYELKTEYQFNFKSNKQLETDTVFIISLITI
jgi:hypothetical protein